jgi:hypothetical protein
MHNHEHKVKIIKQNPMRGIMQLVLASLKEMRVSLDEAWLVLSPKHSLLKRGVRTYTVWHEQVLMIGDKDNQNKHQHGLPPFMLLKE